MKPRPPRGGVSKIEEHAHLVGVLTDREVAELAGVSAQSVAQWRDRRGIPRAPARAREVEGGRKNVAIYLSTEEYEELLRDVAAAGSPSLSAYIRQRLGFSET